MKKILMAALLLTACGTEVTKVVRGPKAENGHSIVSTPTAAPAGIICPNAGTGMDLYIDMDDSLTVSEGDKYQGGMVACNGLNGLAGANGSTGADGSNGTNGVDGGTGQDGAAGIDGLAGTDGAQGIPGAPGPQGLAGADGLAGAEGVDGTDGTDGVDGTDGTDGAPGSTVTITEYSSASCTSIAESTYYAKAGDLYDTADCAASDKVNLSSTQTMWISSSQLVTKANSSIRVIKFN